MRVALRLAMLGLGLFAATSANATKPCWPNTWFANPERAESEWRKDAAMVFLGTIESVSENIHPYPNCMLEDKTQCPMKDSSSIIVSISRWEKGELKERQKLSLSSGFCAQNPPKDIGKHYRFYTNSYDVKNPTPYIFYAPASMGSNQ
jgi:hypothetical protein